MPTTKSRFFPPGPLKVERIVDGHFVELDGVLFGFGCFRPLRLAEAKTEERAKQFMGRDVNFPEAETTGRIMAWHNDEPAWQVRFDDGFYAWINSENLELLEED